MLIHCEWDYHRVRCIQNFTQSCRSKQKNNSLHEMDFPADNYTHINVLYQMELIENRAVRWAWIVHYKLQSIN